MLSFQKRVFQTETGGSAPSIPTEFALRSNDTTSNPASSSPCGFSLEASCYIDTQVNETITVGDIVYAVSGGPFVFVGNNEYYLVQIQSGAMARYICQIDGSGVVTSVYGTCPL